jgi:hypothetical protein
LTNSLISLKKRGFNVDRILNRQREERLRLDAEAVRDRPTFEQQDTPKQISVEHHSERVGEVSSDSEVPSIKRKGWTDDKKGWMDRIKNMGEYNRGLSTIASAGPAGRRTRTTKRASHLFTQTREGVSLTFSHPRSKVFVSRCLAVRLKLG